MKKITFNKSVALLVVLILVTFCFSGCWLWEVSPISFEYDLTQQKLEEALMSVDRVEQEIDEGNNFGLVRLVSKMNMQLSYVAHQYAVGQILYYSNLKDESAYQKFVFAEDGYMTMREQCLYVLKKLYESDLPAKESVFKSWTEEDIQILYTTDEAVNELKRRESELTREYLALDEDGSQTWSDAVENIYFDFIKNADAISTHYGYENYYEYASAEIYLREYTKEQRERFRESVKEYLLPFYNQTYELYIQKRSLLNSSELREFNSLRKGQCTPDNLYLTGYINSYSGNMKTVMNYLFERDALVYTQSDNAYGMAFTNYSSYYDQPYVFLGNGYQDIFTLVHELGHYTAYYHFINGDIGYDTCEVHSQGNEWLLTYYLDGELDEDVYDVLVLWQLSNSLETVILSTLVDEYEEKVYEREITSVNEFDTIMATLYTDYEGIENLGDIENIYNYVQRATMRSPVYYLNYATSSTVSMSLYSIASENGYATAQAIYADLCLETPTDNAFLDTLADVGLPSPFEEQTIFSIIDAFDFLNTAA